MGQDKIGKPDIILQAKNLTRTVSTDVGPLNVIDSFSFEFERGRIYTVVGPSGSGKTSLLRLFNRLDEKCEGEVIFDGNQIEEYPTTQLRQKIALAFQIPYLFPGTVTTNLAYCCNDQQPFGRNDTTRFLNLVGLEPEFAERNTEKLSVGQKQRVALARSLVQEPEILLLDEPTSALDPGAARTIEELIIKLNDELGLTIIMVTHNFRQAQRLKGISLLLIKGSLVEWGLSKDVFAHPENELTRRFVNGDLR